MTDWGTFYTATAQRSIRLLCLEALELAGAPDGRLAVDLGAGAGVETAALLVAGWTVNAVDSAAGARERITATASEADRGRLTVAEEPFETLASLPPAGLVYAGFSLPFQTPAVFARTWELIRAALTPGSVLAVNLFGDRDSWAVRPGMTCHTAADARRLLDGLDVIAFREDERDGRSLEGPKHWHTFDVIARA